MISLLLLLEKCNYFRKSHFYYIPFLYTYLKDKNRVLFTKVWICFWIQFHYLVNHHPRNRAFPYSLMTNIIKWITQNTNSVSLTICNLDKCRRKLEIRTLKSFNCAWCFSGIHCRQKIKTVLNILKLFFK